MVRVSPRSEFDQTRRPNREKHEQKRDGRYQATLPELQKAVAVTPAVPLAGEAPPLHTTNSAHKKCATRNWFLVAPCISESTPELTARRSDSGSSWRCCRQQL